MPFSFAGNGILLFMIHCIQLDPKLDFLVLPVSYGWHPVLFGGKCRFFGEEDLVAGYRVPVTSYTLQIARIRTKGSNGYLFTGRTWAFSLLPLPSALFLIWLTFNELAPFSAIMHLKKR
ncbi:MAG: hypothetical protein ACJ751_03300 [Niastella sp.]|uniref:hypothetical protein n=1 Tax=Niastella sp. TaxID=1869183 RepID=UPI003899D304